MSEDLPQVGKYKLLHLLATGGMGEVFLAKVEGPAGFQKTVVIKRILKHLATDPQFVEMFLNEARLAAVLAHPNIVQIFELGEEDGSYFIAMEYIHGRSLRAIKQKLLESRQLFSPMLAARLCSHALAGLHYAHTLTDDAGTPLHVVHRDISPDNVLVSVNGQVKLVDFGIAKAANAISTTRTGTIKGKYAYMAPEQLTGGTIDGRTDVYAMGVLMYELLTGARPYTAATEPALIHTILSTRPAPPRERNPSLPQPINDVILKAMEKDPAARFSSAEEMAYALEEFITSTGQALTGSQIGGFIKDLFGAEIRQSISGMMTPKPGTNPSRSSQVGTKPGSRPAAPAVVPMPTTAQPGAPLSAPTEVVPTPISRASGPKKLTPATPHPPPQDETAVAGAAVPAPAWKRMAMPAVIGAAVLIAASGAYVLGKKSNDAVAAALPPAPQPLAVAAPAPAPPIPAPKLEPKPEPKAEPKVEPVAEVKPQPEPPKPVVVVAAAAKKPSKPRALEPGKVALRVNPWAEVFHEGKSLGITPMAPVTVPAGRQTFTLKNTEIGVTRKVTVNVPSGGQTLLKADLFE